MIWLASYPRSGSTYFCHALLEVYGLPSITFHRETDDPSDPEYSHYPVVNTHLLPSQLESYDPSIPVVYLVRDGRDCVVSLARDRTQASDGKSDFRLNLLAAIEADGESRFGGWGGHVQAWIERADLILYFEELVSDPIVCLEQLRPWIDLPEPNLNKLPAFADSESQTLQFGSSLKPGFSSEARERRRDGNDSRGPSATWKDAFPQDLLIRFLTRHGDSLERTGYLTIPESLQPSEEKLESRKNSRRVSHSIRRSKAPFRVLIDGVKLLDNQIDGVRRYVRELITAIYECSASDRKHWEIDISLGYLGNFPIDSIVNHFLTGSLPEPGIHPLFHHGQINPIVRSQERIEHLKKHGHSGILAERMRLKYHRLCRSCLKRYCAVRQLIQPAKQQYDLCHLTLPNTWQHYQHLSVPLLTTVHDLSNLICPELQHQSNVRTLSDGLRFARKHNSDYLSVSHATKQQMIELLNLSDEKIHVVHNAVCHDQFRPVFEPAQLRPVRNRYKLPEEPFFLCLGTIEPRKNLVNTIRAFQLLLKEYPDLPVQLILAGGTGWQKIDELNRMIGSESRIRYIGFVDDSDLAALYSSAWGLCYASLYEGFGLPILEAMACGTPVIYGDNSSMPEFAAECGLPVIASDPHSIKEAFHRLTTDYALHNELASNAYVRGQALTWRKTARRTLWQYQKLIMQQHGSPPQAARKKAA